MDGGKRLDRRAFLVGIGAVGVGLAPGRNARRIRVPGPVPKTFKEAIRGPVFQRGQPGFTNAAHVYNELFDSVLPNQVGWPNNAADVSRGVRWAVANGVALRARSGGHSYAGYSTLNGGVVIDLRNLRRISVNRRAKTATIGAGAQLIDVYAGLAAQGATIPSGSCPSVGITGVTMGGGMGLAARKFGLTLDNLIGAEIVTWDGVIHQVNSRTNPDLLWGLRGGGGGNFGVVTSLTFRIHPVPSVATYFSVSWPWSSASEAIATWQSWAPSSSTELTSIFHLNATSPPSVTANGQLLGNPNALRGLIGPLLGVPGAQLFTSTTTDYVSMQLLLAGCSGHGLPFCHTVGTRPGGQLQRASFQAKSDYVTKPLSSAGRAALVRATAARGPQPGSGAILFDSYGGAINRVAPDATAFVHRNALFAVQYLTYNGGGAWLGQTWSSMRPFVSGMAYQNYIDASLPKWQRAYYGSNYRRLLALRKSVDPHHVFNFPQAIGR